MMDFNRERSGNIVLLALFMSSWWVLEFCRTTATSCILTAWWRWHRTALMQTRSLMANAWLRQRCCVQAPQSSLVLHTSLSLWTPCTTKGGRRSQGPWWGADTSLGERERSSSVYWESLFLHFYFLQPIPFFSSISTSSSFFQHTFPKLCGEKEYVIVDERDRMRFDVGRQKEIWRTRNERVKSNKRRERVEVVWGYGKLDAL